MKTNKKRWVPWPAPKCPNCGSTSAKVCTLSDDENEVFDGEPAECKDCGHDGYVSVEDSECADIIWDCFDLEY